MRIVFVSAYALPWMPCGSVLQELPDATKCECCNLNQIIQDPWESVDELKRLSSQAAKSQGREPPAAVQTKQQPPSTGHRAAPQKHHESTRLTLALIQMKTQPHSLHNR